MSKDEPPSEDVLRILISTDNHLGFMERDPIRGEDSFNTFEEMLKCAKSMEVDMILLGGDLFHENKPSRHTLFRTMELLRTYCMGDAPIAMEILSDERVNFDGTRYRGVNYGDPNYNVGIPVFSVHGNHDDPSGEGSLSALDLLSASNLINYFGKSDNVDDVVVHPILLRKGRTRVALYGLGHIRDERLYRTFEQEKVKLLRPIENPEDWFSIFVLHQNRVAHSAKNFVDERVLGDWLDFILWGHEHDCRIVPEPSNFHICQPGSSVATSLCEGEAKEKYIGLLEVCGGKLQLFTCILALTIVGEDDFRLQPIRLNTVRPFVIDDICLAEHDLDPDDADHIAEFLVDKIIAMIKQAEDDPKRTDLTPSTPLIRLKVEYTGFKSINPQRFGQQFVGKVANPKDILLFYRRRKTGAPAAARTMREREMLAQVCINPDSQEAGISELVSSFLGVDNMLEILPREGLTEALKTFVEKQENHAIQQFVTKTLEHTQGHLRDTSTPSGALQPDYIQEMVSEMRREEQEERELDSGDSGAHSDLGSPMRSEDGARRRDSPRGTRAHLTSSSSPVGIKHERATQTQSTVDLTQNIPFASPPPSPPPHATKLNSATKRKPINALTDYFSPVDAEKGSGSRKKRWGKRKRGPS